ncbi:unnamed protein product [Trichogramma brassicae]|uniref:Uncharacterized protein n=1 Tax=Trichogramma brassicae TaxID=86971 RepID=A0A6H5IAL1_9HYME|nr:unnamed protein product [Trichogramma brassicae]
MNEFIIKLQWDIFAQMDTTVLRRVSITTSFRQQQQQQRWLWREHRSCPAVAAHTSSFVHPIDVLVLWQRGARILLKVYRCVHTHIHKIYVSLSLLLGT